jgi:hypothetical protein
MIHKKNHCDEHSHCGVAVHVSVSVSICVCICVFVLCLSSLVACPFFALSMYQAV